MTDREIVTEYRYNVIAAHTIRQSIVWNQRHGMPLMDLPDQLRELREMILRFEDVLALIPERRTRNVIRCRYALGWNIQDTAAFMGLSCGLVNVLSLITLRRLDRDDDGEEHDGPLSKVCKDIL